MPSSETHNFNPIEVKFASNILFGTEILEQSNWYLEGAWALRRDVIWERQPFVSWTLNLLEATQDVHSSIAWYINWFEKNREKTITGTSIASNFYYESYLNFFILNWSTHFKSSSLLTRSCFSLAWVRVKSSIIYE